MWLYNKPFNINDYDSFVYLITRLINDDEKPKYYIVKKHFLIKIIKVIWLNLIGKNIMVQVNG